MATKEKTIQIYNVIESEIQTGRFVWFDIVMHRWAFLLENTLFESLQVIFEVQPQPVLRQRFDDFLSQAHQQPIYIFEAGEHGKGLILVDNRFAHACFYQEPKQRLSTPPKELPSLNPQIHKKLQKIIHLILQDLKQSWKGLADFGIHLKRITTHPFRAKVMPPFQRCLVAKLSFKAHGFTSTLTLCFPYLTLDSIVQKFQEKQVLPPESLEYYTEEIQNHFQNVIHQCEYELTAELGKIQLKTREEKTRLEKGEILAIDSLVGTDLTIRVNGTPLLTGKIGQSGENFATKITGLYEQKKKEYRERTRPFQSLTWPSS